MVEGNYLGVTASGSVALGNAESGVAIYAGASDNTIGGSVAGSGNVISGNVNNGVYISDLGTTGNVIEGDDIGTDSTSSIAVPNYNGVVIQNGAAGNIIGVTLAGSGSGDVISGNDSNGVYITEGTSGNVVEGSDIGLNASESKTLPNSGNGVYIGGGASGNLIGGTATISGGALAGAGNVIAGNSGDGVQLVGNGTDGNVVDGDFIGLSAAGTTGMGNSGNGVSILGGASYNTIGGTASGTANVISANGGNGVDLSDSGTTFNVVEGNLIGTDPTGLNAAGNGGDGVLVQNGATDNTIGGTIPGSGNVISANGGNGVRLTGTGTDDNFVEGNNIGLSLGGTTLDNGGYDVQIDSGASLDVVEDNSLPSTATTSGVPTQSPSEHGTPIKFGYNMEEN